MMTGTKVTIEIEVQIVYNVRVVHRASIEAEVEL